MKLRQKLAVVLASAMIITAVPVVTSAASTNGLTHTISVIKGSTVGYDVKSTTTGNAILFDGAAPKLTLQLQSDFANVNHTFYVNAEDAKFNKDAFVALQYKLDNGLADDVQVNVKDGKVLGTTNVDGVYTALTTPVEITAPTFTVNYATGALEATPSTKAVTTNAKATITFLSETQIEVYVNGDVSKEDVLKLPLLVTVGENTPSLTIEGKNSPFSTSKVSLVNGEIGTKALTVKTADPKTISVDGGEISKITIEEATLNALNSPTDKDRQISIKLPNSSDLEFDNIKTVDIKGTYGLNNVAAANGTAQVISNDGKEIIIQLPQVASTKNTTGAIEITGITVAPEGRDDAKLGNVDVTIKGDKIDTTKATVAQVKEFDVLLENTDKVELVAGKDAKEVKVTLKEAAANSLDERRTIFFSLEGAELNDADITASKGTIEKVYSKDKEPKLIGFDLNLSGALTEGKANEVELKFEVSAKANQSGDIKVVAESRSFDKNIETAIGTVKEAIKVEAKGMTVKVGLQGQVGGEIVITETEAGMLERNKQVIIDVVDAKDNGITLKDAKVVAENLQVTDMEMKNGQIILTVKRTSDEAGKITISDIKVDVNRTTPEGTFDVKIGGDAISNLNKVVTNGNENTMKDVIKVADFIVVGTPNTEDNNNGLQKGTGIFKVGEKTYTVNGEAKEMDAAPYISKANRVMVPVRYVSDVFGINGKDVLFSNENGGTITIFAGSRVLQVVNGSNIALVNGVKIPMDEKVTIVDGRTFVPVGEMARLLNVDVEWSNETKTATFKN